MTPSTYRTLRKSIGTQVEVARMLGVDPQTISDRERGKYKISRESEIALESLASVARSDRRTDATRYQARPLVRP